uniref:TACC_C domain-containing protein n=1 Tax=Panagrellus redivivus TaxID=6233 RepID=A0A7E4W478_PANRE
MNTTFTAETNLPSPGRDQSPNPEFEMLNAPNADDLDTSEIKIPECLLNADLFSTTSDNSDGLNATFTCDSDQENLPVEIERPSVAPDQIEALEEALSKEVPATDLLPQAVLRPSYDHENILDDDEAEDGKIDQHILEDLGIPEGGQDAYMDARKRAEELVWQSNLTDLTQMQVYLNAQLTHLEDIRKDDIEMERRKMTAVSEVASCAAPAPMRSTVELEKLANIKDEVEDVIKQYKQSRNMVDTLNAEHERYLQKNDAYSEKTVEISAYNAQRLEAYMSYCERYATLLKHVSELVAEGDATCTAMIERHKTATLDSRTKARLLQLKKGNLEKKENELRSQVNELMEMLENILAVRAQAAQNQTIVGDNTF